GGVGKVDVEGSGVLGHTEINGALRTFVERATTEHIQSVLQGLCPRDRTFSEIHLAGHPVFEGPGAERPGFPMGANCERDERRALRTVEQLDAESLAQLNNVRRLRTTFAALTVAGTGRWIAVSGLHGGSCRQTKLR